MAEKKVAVKAVKVVKVAKIAKVRKESNCAKIRKLTNEGKTIDEIVKLVPEVARTTILTQMSVARVNK